MSKHLLGGCACYVSHKQHSGSVDLLICSSYHISNAPFAPPPSLSLSCSGFTVAGLWCNSRQMGEMAETNLKGLIHLIATMKDCRLPHSPHLQHAVVCQAAGAPIMLAYVAKCRLCITSDETALYLQPSLR